MVTAVFHGTFDPITNGHQEMIERTAELFSNVIVAVAESADKNPLFNLQQRIKMVQNSVQHLINVKVYGFDNLLIDFAIKHQASIVVRGIRDVNDYTYELRLSNTNKCLQSAIETIFLPASGQYSYISSSTVKWISKMGGDVSKFVNSEVNQMLKAQHDTAPT